MAAKNRQTKARQAEAKRRPKTSAPPPSTAGLKPLFSFEYADRNSTKAWAFQPTGAHAAAVLSFLCDMAKLTWREIEQHRAGGHRKHHSQDITAAGIDTDAQKDLARVGLDKVFGEDMFRFRLTGEQRLWGYRVRQTFYIVWWDWDHKVYPTEKS